MEFGLGRLGMRQAVQALKRQNGIIDRHQRGLAETAQENENGQHHVSGGDGNFVKAEK